MSSMRGFIPASTIIRLIIVNRSWIQGEKISSMLFWILEWMEENESIRGINQLSYKIVVEVDSNFNDAFKGNIMTAV